MFATVECRDAPPGMKGFIRDIFTLPEITVERVYVPLGEGFYRVRATEYRGNIPVAETAEKLKRLRHSVIFETNFPCDESTHELEFTPSEFKARLIFNSAAEYIKKIKAEPLKSSLTIFDPEGFFVKDIEIFVPLFSKIVVYTNECTFYERACAELMDKYGVSIPVYGRFNLKVPESTVVICPGEVPFCNFYKGILFTNAEDTPPCAECIRGYGIDLPGEYELLRPQGISKLYFAAALYEKGGVKSLGNLAYKKLYESN